MRRVLAALAAGVTAVIVYSLVEPTKPAEPPVEVVPPTVSEEPSQRRAVLFDDEATGRVEGSAAWVLKNNAAVAALEAGDIERAVTELEAARALGGGDERAAIVDSNLAEALTRRGRAAAAEDRWDAALADLERAIELDPTRDDVADLLDRWRRERSVEGDFASYTSQRFRLTFDGDREAILLGAQRAVDVLEAAYGEYWLFFGHDVLEPGERLDVVLYSPEQFHDLTGLGHWAGGAFDGRVRVPVVDFDGDEARWTSTLWHELAHAFMHDIAGNALPGWLDEGLAQWLEPNNEAAAAAARRGLTAEALHPLSSLDGSLASLREPAAIRRAYAQALAFTDHLIERHGEFVVREMVAAAGRGVPVATRFAELVGFSLEQAHRDFSDEL